MKKFFTSHKKLSVFLAIILIVSLAIGVQAARDQARQSKLYGTINAVETALESKGFRSINRYSGCGHGQGVYGPEAKQCNTGLIIETLVDDREQAHDMIREFKEVLDSELQLAWEQFFTAPDSSMGSAGYVNEYSSTGECGASYNIRDNAANQQGAQLRLGFGCNNTSWVIRTFGT